LHDEPDRRARGEAKREGAPEGDIVPSGLFKPVAVPAHGAEQGEMARRLLEIPVLVQGLLALALGQTDMAQRVACSTIALDIVR
jgi:hypothetical protein